MDGYLRWVHRSPTGRIRAEVPELTHPSMESPMKSRYLLLIPALVMMYLTIGCFFRGPDGEHRDHGHGEVHDHGHDDHGHEGDHEHDR